jgi:putative sterol carrier protein
MSVSEEFFAELSQRGHDPRLHQAKGSVQFEIAQKERTDRCIVVLSHGDVTVASGAVDDTATCFVRCPGPLFDDIISGRANALAAMLRGELSAEGDLQLLYQFQRVFPGPPGAVHPRERVAAKRDGS